MNFGARLLRESDSIFLVMQVSMDSLARTVKQSSITEKRKAGRWSSYVACVVNHTQEV